MSSRQTPLIKPVNESDSKSSIKPDTSPKLAVAREEESAYPPETSKHLSWAANKFIKTPTFFMFDMAVIILIGVILACAFLSRLIELDIYAKGAAEINSASGVREALAGADGRIAKLYKKNGDAVAENEIIALVSTDSAPTEEVEKISGDLKASINRINSAKQSTALLDVGDINFSVSRINDPSLLQDLVNVQQSIRTFQEQKRRINSELSNELIFTNQRINFLNNSMGKVQENHVASTAEMQFIRQRIEVLNEKLVKMKASPQKNLLQPYIESTEEELGKLKSQVVASQNQAKFRVEQKTDQIVEELSRLRSQVVSAQNQAKLKLNEALSELLRTLYVADGAIENYQKRHEIRSPINGVIAKMAESQSAHVVVNKPIAIIVPKTSEFIANVRIPSKDIAKLKVGQPVVYKVEAYPYQRYGLFTGTVKSFDQVSADNDTAVAEDNFIVKATIEVPQSLPDDIKKQMRFVVGMRAEAAIITERKSLKDLFIEKFFFKMRY